MEFSFIRVIPVNKVIRETYIPKALNCRWCIKHQILELPCEWFDNNNCSYMHGTKHYSVNYVLNTYRSLVIIC